MKRDLDLIRLILLKIENNKELNPFLPAAEFTFEGYEPDLVKYNLMQLIEADYINGKVQKYLGGEIDLFVVGLTWNGHDFLDLAKNDNNWNKAKKVGEAAGAMTLEIMRKILVEIASNVALGMLKQP